jgi:Mg-chelatase subunit ChlI
LARSLRAFAALEGVSNARVADLERVARLALRHRRSRAADQDMPPWEAAEKGAVAEVIARHGAA